MSMYETGCYERKNGWHRGKRYEKKVKRQRQWSMRGGNNTQSQTEERQRWSTEPHRDVRLRLTHPAPPARALLQVSLPSIANTSALSPSPKRVSPRHLER